MRLAQDAAAADAAAWASPIRPPRAGWSRRPGTVLVCAVLELAHCLW